MSDFWPFRRVQITDGSFAGQDGWIAGPDIRQERKLTNPEEGHYWVIVRFRDGETAVKLTAEQMKLEQ